MSRRMLVAPLTVLGLTGLVAAVLTMADGHEQGPGPRQANIQPGLAAGSKVTRASGTSVVLSDTPGSPAHLRSCPSGPPAGDTTGDCGVIDDLPTGSVVQMRCWTDAEHPPGETNPSSRWFYVNEVSGGRLTGYSGYLYSGEIDPSEQIRTPGCDGHIIQQYNYPPPTWPAFRVVGTCTTTGGTLTSVSSGFTPGGEYTITAAYPNGSPYHLAADRGTVRSDGSVSWTWPCAGDPAGTYTTTITDVSTGNDVENVSFTVQEAPRSAPPPSTSGPVPAVTSSAPASTTPPNTTPNTTGPVTQTGQVNIDPDTQSYGGTVNVWSLPARNDFCSATFPTCDPQSTVLYPVSQGQRVTALCYRPQGQRIITGTASQPGYDDRRWVHLSSGGWLPNTWFVRTGLDPNLPTC